MTDSWTATVALMAELWPDWKPTDAQRTEFRDRLAHRRREWIHAAIRDHYSLDCPKDGVFISPRLSRIIQRYQTVAEAGESTAKASGPLGWRPEWSETRNGCTGRIAALVRFDTKRQALAYAESQRDAKEPHAFPVTTSSAVSHIDESEVMEDYRSNLADILTWPPDRITAALVEIKRLDIIPHNALPDPTSSPLDWTRFAVGIVHAADWEIGRRYAMSPPSRDGGYGGIVR